MYIQWKLPKTERDRSGIFSRFRRFPFYKRLCFNKTKYKKYDRLGLQWRNNLKWKSVNKKIGSYVLFYFIFNFDESTVALEINACYVLRIK